MTDFPIHPKHPERICWGCDKYCPADDLRCGNGTIRTEHPIELLGEDWFEWLMKKEGAAASPVAGAINLLPSSHSPATADREHFLSQMF